MRKVEQDMVRAVQTRTSRKFGNTEVRCNDGGATVVLLHGNLIAECKNHQWRFTLAGWPTPTTRSRINALAQGLNLRVRVWQTRHRQYVVGPHSTQETEVSPWDWF